MINRNNPIIKKTIAETPELFHKKSFIEDARDVQRFGIRIPGKESFPNGYMKLYPEDFIVEEIDTENKVQTIDYQDVLENNATIPGEGETIYATLVKCGLSTLEVIKELAEKLNVPERSIGYAGIKDKHAITSQRISIRGCDEEKLKQIASPFYFLKDVFRGKGVISMTNLNGNRFGIFVRMNPGATLDIEPKESEAFYNFFYLQRFGSPRLINYLWGYELLRGNYEQTVRSLMFDVQPRELPFISNLRVEAKTKKTWAEVRNVFEPILNIMICEAPILDHLVKHPTDYSGALSTIPDQVQLWLYGLSSLLFNEKISSYIQTGMQPPSHLPLIFSNERRDIDTYRAELQSLGIFPPPFQNLKPLPFIRLAHRMVQTTETAKNIEVRHAAQGSFISFSLPKGAYATTFLSHHINIIGDCLPDGMSTDKIEGSLVSSNPERARTVDIFRKLENMNKETELI
ncbi:MAG: tRNA pseudouridine synthase TruD, tRNA pseudouridsynthase [Candidatus Parcubacteria bacterium]|jgi:TruD family tRNA pseudouridine synthase